MSKPEPPFFSPGTPLTGPASTGGATSGSPAEKLELESLIPEETPGAKIAGSLPARGSSDNAGAARSGVPEKRAASANGALALGAGTPGSSMGCWLTDGGRGGAGGAMPSSVAFAFTELFALLGCVGPSASSENNTDVSLRAPVLCSSTPAAKSGSPNGSSSISTLTGALSELAPESPNRSRAGVEGLSSARAARPDDPANG